jgi:membrane fusion protein (multidrug efflux system)
MKPLIIIASVLAALIVIKVFFWKDSEDPASSQAGGRGGASMAMQVGTIAVKYDESNLLVYSSGTLAPNEEVELRPELSGKLVQLNIQEGSLISKGQLIAKIKDDDIRAQLKKVALEQDLAKQTEARQKRLVEIEAISKEEYDLSANRVNTLAADKELLEVQLERTEVRAPFSGRIGLKSISQGAYVTPSSVIAILIQTDPMKLDFNVPEKYLSMVKPGQEVVFEVDGINNKFKARIIAIDPKIDQNLRMIKIRAVTSNGGHLLSGMFAKVNLNLGANRAIMIPSEAIIPVLEGKKVYIKKNGMVEEVFVETGLRNESKVEVLSGLNAGDSLITTAIMSLKPGMKVRSN